MNGYDSIVQFIQDYQYLRLAKKIDPGREGETITSLLKRRIDMRMKNASKQFKEVLKKRKYSLQDLKIIATHDTVKNLGSMEFFVKECFGINYVAPQQYKAVLSSPAFKSGRLKRLYEFIPLRIDTKNDFIRFLRSRRGIGKMELSVIMHQICDVDWELWLDEFVEKNKITQEGNRWFL